jgi:hypothetical protein
MKHQQIQRGKTQLQTQLKTTQIHKKNLSVRRKTVRDVRNNLLSARPHARKNVRQKRKTSRVHAPSFV